MHASISFKSTCCSYVISKRNNTALEVTTLSSASVSCAYLRITLGALCGERVSICSHSMLPNIQKYNLPRGNRDGLNVIFFLPPSFHFFSLHIQLPIITTLF